MNVTFDFNVKDPLTFQMGHNFVHGCFMIDVDLVDGYHAIPSSNTHALHGTFGTTRKVSKSTHNETTVQFAAESMLLVWPHRKIKQQDALLHIHNR